MNPDNSPKETQPPINNSMANASSSAQEASMADTSEDRATTVQLDSGVLHTLKNWLDFSIPKYMIDHAKQSMGFAVDARIAVAVFNPPESPPVYVAFKSGLISAIIFKQQNATNSDCLFNRTSINFGEFTFEMKQWLWSNSKDDIKKIPSACQSIYWDILSRLPTHQLHVAAGRGDIIKRGISDCRGLDVNAMVDRGDHSCFAPAHSDDLSSPFLSDSDSDSEADPVYWSPLHFAAWAGQVESAEWLIEHGANSHCKDSEGKTPLLIAIDQGHVNTVRLLFSRGALHDNCESDFKFDTLSVAFEANKNQLELLQFLICQGVLCDNFISLIDDIAKGFDRKEKFFMSLTRLLVILDIIEQGTTLNEDGSELCHHKWIFCSNRNRPFILKQYQFGFDHLTELKLNPQLQSILTQRKRIRAIVLIREGQVVCEPIDAFLLDYSDQELRTRLADIVVKHPYEFRQIAPYLSYPDGEEALCLNSLNEADQSVTDIKRTKVVGAGERSQTNSAQGGLAAEMKPVFSRGFFSISDAMRLRSVSRSLRQQIPNQPNLTILSQISLAQWVRAYNQRVHSSMKSAGTSDDSMAKAGPSGL